MDVVNSTSSLVIHSQCGITDTQYNYTVSPNDLVVCDTYTFTVTPVNIVGNGVSASVTQGELHNRELNNNYEEKIYNLIIQSLYCLEQLQPSLLKEATIYQLFLMW